MSTWLTIGGGVCLAITVVGLALSVLVWRRKGARSGIRGVAWSLLPFGAWLTRAVPLIGHIGSAVVSFASGFVFSPRTWLGVVVLVVAALLFVVSGGIPLLRLRKRHDKRKTEERGRPAADRRAVTKAQSPDHTAPPAADDDLGEVQEILRRRGIN